MLLVFSLLRSQPASFYLISSPSRIYTFLIFSYFFSLPISSFPHICTLLYSSYFFRPSSFLLLIYVLLSYSCFLHPFSSLLFLPSDLSLPHLYKFISFRFHLSLLPLLTSFILSSPYIPFSFFTVISHFVPSLYTFIFAAHLSSLISLTSVPPLVASIIQLSFVLTSTII